MPTWVLTLLVYSFYILGVPYFGSPVYSLSRASVCCMGIMAGGWSFASLARKPVGQNYGLRWMMGYLMVGWPTRLSYLGWPMRLSYLGFSALFSRLASVPGPSSVKAPMASNDPRLTWEFPEIRDPKKYDPKVAGLSF